jgi:pyruvate, orthophosphate dikinase
MQDLEFTVERGKLYMLQTRTGKRSAAAAIRIAVDLVDEGLIKRWEAVKRIDPEQLEQLLHPMMDPSAEVEVLTTGLPASPGAASGQVVFNPEEAAERGGGWRGGDPGATRDLPGGFRGHGRGAAILTARGGMTSHAAVVARGMGKCCIVGATAIVVDEAYRRFTVGEHTVRHGDWITLDGSTGRVILGQVPTVEPEPGESFHRLMKWADEVRRLGVRANADTPRDAERGRQFGAEGIGLCRTEHMFFEGDRIDAVREMILSENADGRRRALDKLLPMQQADFIGIFRAMDGLPVTIRLLDPPLHEFLPHGGVEIKNLAGRWASIPRGCASEWRQHAEANPMLGHRGVRLGISYPEITRMQTRAIFEAAVAVKREGVRPLPEIMVPLVAASSEENAEGAGRHRGGAKVMARVRRRDRVPRRHHDRAAAGGADADRIAEEADFFSFGTNDLTQTTFGLSRDDAGSFLPNYVEKGILAADPFQTLDIEGVGSWWRSGVKLGRGARPDLKVGICGEHGGDPASVEFFHKAQLDYVSCSPFRVPVARLAAAHAVLKELLMSGDPGPGAPEEDSGASVPYRSCYRRPNIPATASTDRRSSGSSNASAAACCGLSIASAPVNAAASGTTSIPACTVFDSAGNMAAGCPAPYTAPMNGSAAASTAGTPGHPFHAPVSTAAPRCSARSRRTSDAWRASTEWIRTPAVSTSAFPWRLPTCPL